MKTVWKYELPEVDVTLQMPQDAELLHVAAQRGVPCLWAAVDPDLPMRSRRFYIVGTGHPIPPDTRPIPVGSFLTDPAGTFVFHVFESLDSRMQAAMDRV